MSGPRIGVQLQQAEVGLAELRDAWRRADEIGADSIWVWDHFFPIWTDPTGQHLEGWTLLAALAADTSTAMVGTLVSSNSYRNPDLLADMARTVDHISGGRAYLGLGSGWVQKDYDEYGYEFGTPGSRLADLESSLPRLRERLAALNPQPVGALPILIGGQGEKVTLRIVAEHADAWNAMGSPDDYGRLNQVLDDWCAEVGRDPGDIERTVLIDAFSVDHLDAYVDAGADHIIVMAMAPFDLAPLERLIELRG